MLFKCNLLSLVCCVQLSCTERRLALAEMQSKPMNSLPDTGTNTAATAAAADVLWNLPDYLFSLIDDDHSQTTDTATRLQQVKR